MMLYISMIFHENILKGFQVIERTRLRDGWTDRQPRQKQYVSTPVRGRHKYISCGPHSFREDLFSFSHYKTMGANDPRGLVSLDIRGMVGRIFFFFFFFFSYYSVTHLFSPSNDISRVGEDHPLIYLTI